MVALALLHLPWMLLDCCGGMNVTVLERQFGMLDKSADLVTTSTHWMGAYVAVVAGGYHPVIHFPILCRVGVGHVPDLHSCSCIDHHSCHVCVRYVTAADLFCCMPWYGRYADVFTARFNHGLPS